MSLRLATTALGGSEGGGGAMGTRCCLAKRGVSEREGGVLSKLEYSYSHGLSEM